MFKGLQPSGAAAICATGSASPVLSFTLSGLGLSGICSDLQFSQAVILAKMTFECFEDKLTVHES